MFSVTLSLSVMGCFYTNYTLRGPGQEAVAAMLAGRSAIVTPEENGCVVVFDKESEEQNFEIIAELAARLSGSFGCPLLAVLNHDDGFLWYQLYVNGQLMDEYNSSPNYFDGAEDDDSAPSGGDAAALCSAFSSDNVREVKRILTKPTGLGDDGYPFAVDRHSDIASAVGVPQFGVAGGYELVSEGELPAGLDDDTVLIRTEELPAPEPNPLLVPPKAVPGYYKVSFRAHPKLTRSLPSGWMPGVWGEMECTEGELSESCLAAVTVHRQKLKEFGFAEVGFKKLGRLLNPNHRDNGGINFLDGSGCHFGQLIYNKSYYAGSDAVKEKVLIAFTAVFENEIESFTNEAATFFKPLPYHRVNRIESDDVAFVYQSFVQHLTRRIDKPRQFADLQSLREWFDAEQFAIFEERVRTGIFVRMSDYEVTVARSKLRLGDSANC
jgi:hypothetical protein